MHNNVLFLHSKCGMSFVVLFRINVLRKLIISYKQCPESYRHNHTFDQQLKIYFFGIDIRLLFLLSIARTTGMNMSVETQEIAN